jgi:predicted small secreted protein
LDFPERIYTETEHKTAKELIDKGYKHHVAVEGSLDFRQKVYRVLELVKIAGYYEFLQTYIGKIIEIDGLTQLRETEAAIWANKFAVENPVDAASLFVQKTHHMKQYIDGEVYYGGTSEKRSVEKRMEFLETLKKKSHEKEVTAECERLLQMWKDSSLAP